ALASLRLYPRLPDHFRPARDIGPGESVELLDARFRRLEAHRDHALADVEQAYHLERIGVDLADDRRRRALRHVYPVPSDDLEARNAGLGDRRQLRRDFR